ncbi:MAG: nucleoside-triphosphatase [Bacillota bacterium]|nr:nucleoside-triphosphatase [Bacillota bacterium]
MKDKTNKAKHLFISGEKGIGKSTLLKYLVEKNLDRPLDQENIKKGRLSGFLTRKLPSPKGEGNGFSTYILRVRGSFEDIDQPSYENMLFYCGDPNRIENSLEKFNSLGCEMLAQVQDGDLVLMDELGPAESKAEKFQQRVFDLLDGKLGQVSVYGVLQKADSEFLDKIGKREDVRLIYLTLENRDQFYED